MKVTTADRLKELMEIRGLKQIDIVEKCQTLSKRYGIKINRSDISQYVSGKVLPKQNKLTVLGMALNVNEAWLMGYDVPMERVNLTNVTSTMPIPVKPTKTIPIVGTVACGNPIYAEENILEYISVNSDDNVDFALYADGDSMNNCKIDDGDTIFIRKQSIVDNGEIALVLIDDSATIKRFFDYGDKVVLRPDSTNPEHKEQIYDKRDYNINIQGKVIFIKTFVN